ncbi:MAG: glycosyltransferase [Caldilineaceae bacterium]|nr:glycosyltransferase [Caldilineaceae bacterium]
MLYYYSWWSQLQGWSAVIWLLVFAFALFYTVTQVLGSWLLYLFAKDPSSTTAAPQDLTVDIYVTAYHEPYDLVRRTLAAACAMKGPYLVWLLDDGDDPMLERLAADLGAGYLTRTEKKDAKAGNVNAALPRTYGDVIAIFDVDHTPKPNYLTQALKPFSDPDVGFVQVMVTFGNQDESWVASAAAETSIDFYNPTSFGIEAIGGTTMMGSNSLIRREALNDVGGYHPGLAEDLATSLALHAAGWKSAYVAEPLAPGIAPPDLSAWFTQQFKWARGVFELLLTVYPRIFFKLSWGMRLSYAVRMTKYLIGPIICIHLIATVVALFSDNSVRGGLLNYLSHLAPLVFCDMLIKQEALRTWRHPLIPASSLWSAVMLVVPTWPVYTLAWIMALLRLPLSFRLTPKQSSGRVNPIWLLPQIAILLLIIAGIVLMLAAAQDFPVWLLFFALALMIPHFVLLLISVYGSHRDPLTEEVYKASSTVQTGWD